MMLPIQKERYVAQCRAYIQLNEQLERMIYNFQLSQRMQFYYNNYNNYLGYSSLGSEYPNSMQQRQQQRLELQEQQQQQQRQRQRQQQSTPAYDPPPYQSSVQAMPPHSYNREGYQAYKRQRTTNRRQQSSFNQQYARDPYSTNTQQMHHNNQSSQRRFGPNRNYNPNNPQNMTLPPQRRMTNDTNLNMYSGGYRNQPIQHGSGMQMPTMHQRINRNIGIHQQGLTNTNNMQNIASGISNVRGNLAVSKTPLEPEIYMNQEPIGNRTPSQQRDIIKQEVVEQVNEEQALPTHIVVKQEPIEYQNIEVKMPVPFIKKEPVEYADIEVTMPSPFPSDNIYIKQEQPDYPFSQGPAEGMFINQQSAESSTGQTSSQETITIKQEPIDIIPITLDDIICLDSPDGSPLPTLQNSDLEVLNLPAGTINDSGGDVTRDAGDHSVIDSMLNEYFSDSSHSTVLVIDTDEDLERNRDTAQGSGQSRLTRNAF